MAIGIYKAFRRRQEVSSAEPTVFLSNFQAWLSVFGFSTSAAGILAAIWGWHMLRELPPPLFLGALTVLAIFVIGFVIIALLSLVQLVKMVRHGWRGIPYKYDPITTPDNVLKAIKPVDVRTNFKEYRSVVDRLTKSNNKLGKYPLTTSND